MSPWDCNHTTNKVCDFHVNHIFETGFNVIFGAKSLETHKTVEDTKMFENAA